jgi:hypothetical protein
LALLHFLTHAVPDVVAGAEESDVGAVAGHVDVGGHCSVPLSCLDEALVAASCAARSVIAKLFCFVQAKFFGWVIFNVSVILTLSGSGRAPMLGHVEC